LIDLVVVGTSWGGLQALELLLARLPDELDAPIAIAQHRGPDAVPDGLARLLSRHCRRAVSEAEDKDPIEPRRVYLAPPDYHLLVQRGSFALSTEDRVAFARPSIDVLFETAAVAYGAGVAGVVLTGANADGATGLARIVAHGGHAIVQDPVTAERPTMPAAALARVPRARVLPLERIPRALADLCLVRA
jgi:two-component system chemotaxis response regulator CheB